MMGESWEIQDSEMQGLWNEPAQGLSELNFAAFQDMGPEVVPSTGAAKGRTGAGGFHGYRPAVQTSGEKSRQEPWSSSILLSHPLEGMGRRRQQLQLLRPSLLSSPPARPFPREQLAPQPYSPTRPSPRPSCSTASLQHQGFGHTSM